MLGCIGHNWESFQKFHVYPTCIFIELHVQNVSFFVKKKAGKDIRLPCYLIKVSRLLQVIHVVNIALKVFRVCYSRTNTKRNSLLWSNPIPVLFKINQIFGQDNQSYCCGDDLLGFHFQKFGCHNQKC